MSSFAEIDLEILKKYNQPGPRYTSYPTAPLFSQDFTAGDFTAEIISTNSGAENAADLSLYFHFPFCESLCYFCGCNMMVSRDRRLISEYNERLKKEIETLTPLISKNRKVSQMHWGGGTPSYLTPDEIRDVGEFIKSKFNFAPNIEASVEIDPRGLTFEHLKSFREIGFNRISLGVQDFNPQVQETINRIQPENITRQTVEWVRQLGFGSINLDLIYGLPFQTLRSFRQTVETVIDISPDRIAVFNYAHVPWLKKHQNIFKTETMPSPAERLIILKQTIEQLVQNGYEYIGLDHFAKPTDELAIAQKNNTLYRNFQGYSTKAGCDVYAFGVSAISQFQNIYAQNLKNIKDYYARIETSEAAINVGYRMTFDDHVRKETIMQLMCHLQIDKRSIENRFGISFEKYFADDIKKLDPFIVDGLLENNAERIFIKGAGKLIIRNVAMCFDAHLAEMAKEKKPVFSKTV
ncbi:MAG: oxygen-independent coproporphyrinogen III oxidase [Acidobacteria bacterium]|nr:oxygen-independent coproporphyrinogen III oxidase [Acidobacteriota bacterium]MCA1637915.1 oxygen-independent coproporphyrinogen III oxidase [Acidobacteriota bacterium]